MNCSRLKELLHYCPLTGIFTWKETRGGSVAGSEAGNLNNGYMRIGIDGSSYLSHRLAVLYMTGKMPADKVDHVNHDTVDNNYLNLREADYDINNKNASLRRDSSTKVTGVGFVKKLNKFKAYIQVDGKQKHLGVFSTIEEATSARLQANTTYNYHENHGKEAI